VVRDRGKANKVIFAEHSPTKGLEEVVPVSHFADTRFSATVYKR
jgi:hypothetical protein